MVLVRMIKTVGALGQDTTQDVPIELARALVSDDNAQFIDATLNRSRPSAQRCGAPVETAAEEIGDMESL